MPVSKKRVKKNQRKPTGPPISKKELASRKKPMSRQRIAIYVVSALIILSMAISFIVSGLGGGTPSQTGSTDASSGEIILSTPAPGNDGDAPASDSGADGATGSESSGQ